MTSEGLSVVLDTCVLLSPRVADVLMDLRAEKLFFANWTATIDSEFMRHMPRLFNATQAQAASRLMAMKKRCPEWEIGSPTLTSPKFPQALTVGIAMWPRRPSRCGTYRIAIGMRKFSS